MKLVYSIICSLLVVVVMSCSSDNGKGYEAHEHEETESGHDEVIELSEEQMKTVGIRIGSLEQKNLRNVVKVNGVLKVVPQDKAEVSSLVGGIVRRIMVTEGSWVSEGQVVAWIENTDIVELQKNYLTAVRQCQAARTDYERQKGLSAYGAGVKKALQQSYSAYQIARVEMNGLASQLRQLSVSPARVSKGKITTQIPVYAPISGVVNSIMASTGSFADMQKPLMQISNTSGIYSEMKVFEKDLYSIKNGQKVELRLTNHPAVRLQGVVSGINQAFDPQTRAVSVHVRLEGHEGTLLIPGMYVSGLIDTGRLKTPAIPDEAVVSVENIPYIFLLEKSGKEDGKRMYYFKRIKVITGVSELGYTQVTPADPLPEKARVVTANAFYLASMIGEHAAHAH